MPNLGPTQLVIGLFVFAFIVAAVYVGVKLALRSGKK